MQDPDLTNSLVGVLTRFRQDRVAFMADIQAMFRQVRVPDEHVIFSDSSGGLMEIWNWPSRNIR